MSGGPADLPALLEEVRNMADRGGMMLIMIVMILSLELVVGPF